MKFGKQRAESGTPKPPENAPKTSWWAQPGMSRDELSERARAEQTRLRNSKMGLIGVPDRWINQ